MQFKNQKQQKDIERLKVNGWKKIYQMNTDQNNVDIAV